MALAATLLSCNVVEGRRVERDLVHPSLGPGDGAQKLVAGRVGQTGPTIVAKPLRPMDVARRPSDNQLVNGTVIGWKIDALRCIILSDGDVRGGANRRNPTVSRVGAIAEDLDGEPSAASMTDRTFIAISSRSATIGSLPRCARTAITTAASSLERKYW